MQLGLMSPSNVLSMIDQTASVSHLWGPMPVASILVGPAAQQPGAVLSVAWWVWPGRWGLVDVTWQVWPGRCGLAGG